MNTRNRFWIIRILALIGLALSIELAVVYHNANYDKTALYSFCSINDFIDCDGVAKTYLSQFLGIPLAWWGIFLYVFILFLTFVHKFNWKGLLAPLSAFKTPLKYISVLGLFSFMISMYLAGVSFFQIKKICILCFATYFIDLFISLVATNFKNGGYIDSFKASFKDFFEGVKNFKVAFILCLAAAVGFLTYSATTFDLVPHLKFNKSVRKYQVMKRNAYRIKGNTLGSSRAKVQVVVITDFVCPMCRINNIMIHRAVKEYRNISVKHYNYPLDKTCNKKLQMQMHPGACMMSATAIAAKRQGHYWDMASELYDKKPKTVKEIMQIADSLGLNQKRLWFDMNSELTQKTLEADLKYCDSIGVNATPVTIINGEKIVGIKSYEDLVDTLIRHGAVKRGK